MPLEFRESKLWNTSFAHLSLEEKITILHEQLLVVLKDLRGAIIDKHIAEVAIE
jgi:hypothetical protein